MHKIRASVTSHRTCDWTTLTSGKGCPHGEWGSWVGFTEAHYIGHRTKDLNNTHDDSDWASMRTVAHRPGRP